ncbi:hypothetical protein [uncultured Clostridium sp.]|uniref:hypothetical protein n=1 Tax=uncultured Clostridium sp. TaxID=59620 RepID=UPI0025FCA1C3|nr:hypothetical protein [uncultured Clostridium sp.]
MNNYSINFIFNEGDLTFETKTNYKFSAKSKLKAIKEIEKIEDKLRKYLTSFYDKESKTIKGIMEKNNYFSEIILSDYAYKGSIISEKEFYILIDNLYEKYLNLNAILKFEAISFKVIS